MFNQYLFYLHLTLVTLFFRASVSQTVSNKCEENNGGCDENSICSYDADCDEVYCFCKNGYTNVGRGVNTICTDSCNVQNGGCGYNTTCSHESETNTVVCTCKQGFTNIGKGDLVSCKDSCKVNNGGCGLNTICYHDRQTLAVRCACKPGYINASKKGKLLCKDACLINNGNCGINAICSHDPTTNAVLCQCKAGYTNIGTNGDVICQANSEIVTVTTPLKKTRRPSKPVQFNGATDHTIVSINDNTISGILKVKRCRATLFTKKHSRCLLVCNQIQNLLNVYLTALGIIDRYSIEYEKIEGTGEQLEYYYKVSCKKSDQQIIKDALLNSCQSKSLIETFQVAKRPDPDESSSEDTETVRSM